MLSVTVYIVYTLILEKILNSSLLEFASIYVLESRVLNTCIQRIVKLVKF